MVKRIFFIVLLLIGSISLVATAWAEGKLELEVSPLSGSIDDTFIFSVVASNGNTAGHPYLSGGEDFKLTLLGPRN